MTANNLDGLLPCPFCGAAPILHAEKYDPPAHQPVECPTKDCIMSRAWPDVKAWQSRALSAQPAEPKQPCCHDWGVLQNDVGALLRALGMFDGARPESPHAVMQEIHAEILRRLAAPSAAEPDQGPDVLGEKP